MARSLRLELPGGLYHGMSRGNARQPIFLDDDDRWRFLSILKEVVDRLNVVCHAYCLMGNHYHLLLETPDGNLSLAFRHLNGVYAQWFNRRHGRVGHLFQGRFESRLVEKDAYLVTVARYVDLNPVRAKLVKYPFDWKWSSFRALGGWIEPPGFLSTDWLLTQFDARDRRGAHLDYRKFVHAALGMDEPLFDGTPVLGSRAFISKLRCSFDQVTPIKEIPRVQRFAGRPNLDDLLARCGDRRDRNARIRRAYLDHGYTMTQIAKQLGLHVMTISRAIRQVRS